MTKTQLSDLCHYLVGEQPGKIDISRIEDAIDYGQNAEPMKQYGQQQNLDYKKKLLDELEGDDKTGQESNKTNSHVPACLIHLFNFLDKKNTTINAFFKQSGTEETMPARDFVFALNDQAYSMTYNEQAELIKQL